MTGWIREHIPHVEDVLLLLHGLVEKLDGLDGVAHPEGLHCPTEALFQRIEKEATARLGARDVVLPNGKFKLCTRMAAIMNLFTSVAQEIAPMDLLPDVEFVLDPLKSIKAEDVKH